MEEVNLGIPPGLFAYISKSVQETPYYNLLGIQLEKLGPGHAELSITTTRDHANPLGLIHGGLITSLGDAAMGNAVRSIGFSGVTVDMSTAFIAGAPFSEKITASGDVIKAGRKMIFAEARLYAGEKLLAHLKGTFYRIGEIEF